MGRRKNKKRRTYTAMATRQEIQAKQQKEELRKAQQGFIEESNDEIAREVEDNLQKPNYTYVADTNLFISCPDIIPDKEDKNWRRPKKFRPKLENSQVVIPYVVFEELNHIKSEKSHRGMIARKVLRRLDKFFQNTGRDLETIMNLKEPIQTGWRNMSITILPLHRDFSKILPWVPSKDDNDGWIAVTALAATLINEGLPVDGSKPDGFNILDRNNAESNVILLTNDRHLLAKADLFGVRSEKYSFEKPPVFTGCRELTVPAEMFNKFYPNSTLTREDFEYYFPNEPALAANEYIVMHIDDEGELPRSYFTDTRKYKNIARYDKGNDGLWPLHFVEHEKQIPANAGIATYYDAMNDDKIQVINVTGKAGTGKTYQAIVHAIKEVKAGRYTQIILIPSKSAKNPLGALPGNKEQKMEPLEKTAKGAIRSFLASTEEFKEKRKLLYKFGDTDDNTSTSRTEENNGREKGNRENGNNNRNNRGSRRTYGSFTGSFDDLDDNYGYDDVSPEDYGDDGHSKKKKKKDKTFYPGKQEKNANDGGFKKMTYREALEKQVEYIYSRYFVCIPYEEAQGDSYEDSIIIIDEAQRIKIDDADTLLSRPAKHSKLFIMGDVSQIHDSSPEKVLNNALCYSRYLFGDWEGCANIHLVENMRSDIAEVMTRNRDKIRHLLGID